MDLAIPDGQSGAWSISRFEMTEMQAKISAIRDGGRSCPPGTYLRLTRNGHVIMSNTPAEMRDLWPFRYNAKGVVMINGLGLGVATAMALAKPDVTEVTVIELSPDVITLVAPSLADPRLTVINDDAYTWKPPIGKRYSAVWHDIWDDLCTDNLPLMAKLHRKYGRRTDWQGSWARETIQDQKRRDAQASWRWR
jgi:hypothetical protein